MLLSRNMSGLLNKGDKGEIQAGIERIVEKEGD